MKVEVDLGWQLGLLVVVLVACVLIGFALGTTMPREQVEQTACLTSLDLNRDDIALAAAAASNPCGIGVEPYYYPVGLNDANRMVYGIGCLEMKQT